MSTLPLQDANRDTWDPKGEGFVYTVEKMMDTGGNSVKILPTHNLSTVFEPNTTQPKPFKLARAPSPLRGHSGAKPKVNDIDSAAIPSIHPVRLNSCRVVELKSFESVELRGQV